MTRKTQPPEFTSELLEETFELLRNRPRHVTYAKIEKDTGISHHWINAMSRQTPAIEDPGVKRVETLNRYLKSRRVTRKDLKGRK